MSASTVRAMLLNPPVSIAPDGAPLQFIPLSQIPSVNPSRVNLSHCAGQLAGAAELPLGSTRASILIGCEYSATERDAFRARGFDAWSCDLLPTDGDPRWHIQGDVREAIRSRQWGAIILHVDCTAMGVCGNRTYAAGAPKHAERIAAIKWTVETVMIALANSPCVALENPASVIFPILRDQLNADVQYIHPWEHGHPEQKKTGLALWGLPRITPTNNVYAEMMLLPRKERERIFFMSPGKDRGHERARAFPGIANAFADQWGAHLHPGSDTRQHTVNNNNEAFGFDHGGQYDAAQQ